MKSMPGRSRSFQIPIALDEHTFFLFMLLLLLYVICYMLYVVIEKVYFGDFFVVSLAQRHTITGEKRTNDLPLLEISRAEQN